jgi:hypothetical protein
MQEGGTSLLRNSPNVTLFAGLIAGDKPILDTNLAQLFDQG